MQVAQKTNEGKHQELKILDAAIAERKKYHREQEALIRDMTETGNMLLMGLNHDILLAKQELRNIKTDIRTAIRDKVLLNEDLDGIRDEIQLTVVSTTFIGISPAFG